MHRYFFHGVLPKMGHSQLFPLLRKDGPQLSSVPWLPWQGSCIANSGRMRNCNYKWSQMKIGCFQRLSAMLRRATNNSRQWWQDETFCQDQIYLVLMPYSLVFYKTFFLSSSFLPESDLPEDKVFLQVGSCIILTQSLLVHLSALGKELLFLIQT